MSDKPELGDMPIQEDYREKMHAIMSAVDDFLNDGVKGDKRKIGILIMMFPFNSKEGRCNYMSNGANRDDVVKLMEEQIKRFKGEPE